jgi:transcriptional regulator with XRE-family HTH domain
MPGLGHAISQPRIPSHVEPIIMPETVPVAPFVPSSNAPNPPKHPGSVDLHVGLKIRDRRRELGLSQTDLGSEVGISYQQMQKYERGVNRVGASRLAAIAKALKVPVAYFFPGDETQNPTNVGIAAQIVDLQTRLSFIQDELERLRQLLLRLE